MLGLILKMLFFHFQNGVQWYEHITHDVKPDMLSTWGAFGPCGKTGGEGA